MAEHVWSVLCRKGVLDSNNNLSMLDVLEHLKIEGELPKEGVGLKIPMQLVTLWIRSELTTPETIDTRLLIEIPNGRKLEGAAGVVNMDKAPRSRLTVEIGGLPFYGEGVYKFVVQHKQSGKWKTNARVPLQVAVEAKDERERREPKRLVPNRSRRK